MPEPIIFISRNKIREGKASEFRKHYQESIQATFLDKQDTLVQLAFENEETTEFTVIRVFPDATALDSQILGADERSKKTYTFIEPISIEIFGKPNPVTLEKMKKIAGSGIKVKICSNYSGGFIR
ncbi:MAG: hypothetical protein CVU46_00815 [Chloroflexi bacterium HGW-Chloroflexi-8]|jgi:hypothetical protein|nr:MAG: hypothetical protein CVU46_00815 [Chloroflexi bacterium HGW-Chloroflexi-8]